jgi:heme exporter protein C
VLYLHCLKTKDARVPYFISPQNFQAWFRPLLITALAAVALCLPLGLYFGLLASPPDQLQGESVRIMYIHVPAAWMSLMVYSIMAGASAAFLIWKNPLSDIIAQSAAPIGAAFTLLTLITGSLWGKPVWGTWWVWDARLTSELILLFFYLGYMALASAFDSKERAAKSAAILAIVGFINVPIVKFSVDFWSTLHQPASLLRAGGSSIDESMLRPLLLMAGAFFALFIVMLLLKVQTVLLQRKMARPQAK